jgi:hypothetical protein
MHVQTLWDVNKHCQQLHFAEIAHENKQHTIALPQQDNKTLIKEKLLALKVPSS